MQQCTLALVGNSVAFFNNKRCHSAWTPSFETQVSNNAYFYPSKRHHYDVMAKGLLYMYIPYYVPWDAEYINLHSLAVLHATVLHMHSC